MTNFMLIAMMTTCLARIARITRKALIILTLLSIPMAPTDPIAPKPNRKTSTRMMLSRNTPRRSDMVPTSTTAMASMFGVERAARLWV
jgi:hypothetical protein